MKKYLFPIVTLLSTMLLVGLFSCTKEDKIESYKGYISEDSLEVICENVELATQVAGDVFVKCNSIEDVKKHIDEIKKCESVEDVRLDNHAMYVLVKGFGSIPYILLPENDIPKDTLLEQLEKEIRTRADDKFITHNQLENKHACIVNQAIYDEFSRGVEARHITKVIEKMFSTCGYIGESGVKPSVDFFNNKIYDYDMVFIITHGVYDLFDGLHWLTTSDECEKQTDKDKNQNGITKAWVRDVYGKSYKSFSDQLIKVGSVRELRDGKYEMHYYLKVSEKLISTSKRRFDEGRTPVIFNTACQSMKENDNLADAFIEKGAKAYFGYDESDSVGPMAGLYFWTNLTVGRSLMPAYSEIPKEYLYDEYNKAFLVHKFDKNQDFEYACIEHPTLTDVIGFSESDGDVVTLKAKIREYYSGRPSIFYGFYLGETDDPLKATDSYTVKLREDEGCYRESHFAYFEKKIKTKNLKPQTKYYCWAYISDGHSLCFSNMGTFTTPEKGIDQVIPDPIRKTMEPYITIYDGNNPPNIEGIYIIDPTELVHDNTGAYKSGEKGFNALYFKISNQDEASNTLDYEEKEINYGRVVSEADGKGAFISGEGNNFSVYFNTTGVTHLDEYDVTTTHALVITGTKVSDGIKDLRYAFVIVEKEGDRDDYLMNKGDFRVFKDSDGWAEQTTGWPSTRGSIITIHNDQVITPWSIYSIKK